MIRKGLLDISSLFDVSIYVQLFLERVGNFANLTGCTISTESSEKIEICNDNDTYLLNNI